MRTRRAKLVCAFLIAIIVTLDSVVLIAKEKESGISLYFGESFYPNHFRAKIQYLDVSFDGRYAWLFVGSRAWKDSLYVGYGAGLQERDFGLYGSLGYEWSVFEHFALNAEAFARSGLIQGSSFANIYVGATVKW